MSDGVGVPVCDDYDLGRNVWHPAVEPPRTRQDVLVLVKTGDVEHYRVGWYDRSYRQWWVHDQPAPYAWIETQCGMLVNQYRRGDSMISMWADFQRETGV